jgi:hypothetical protein
MLLNDYILSCQSLFTKTFCILQYCPPFWLINTVNSRFKKDLKLQIHLSTQGIFFGGPVFRFTTEIFLKSNNSRFKKEKMGFLKLRVYCNRKYCNILSSKSAFSANLAQNRWMNAVYKSSLLPI